MSDLLHCIVRTERGATYILPADEYETVRQKQKYHPGEMYETNDLFGGEVAFLPGTVVAISRYARPQLEEMAEFFEEVSDLFSNDDPYDEPWR